MRRALILGPGALCGAYGAGVASVLAKEIKFDRILGCSVGVYAATFAVTEQFDIMLDVWRNHVHGKMLINVLNPLKGRNILDLEYLNGCFKKEPHVLNLDQVSSEKGRLIHVLTDCLLDNPNYFFPDGNNIFDSMMASSAVPYIHPKVEIDGRYFYDGGLSDPYPLQKALDSGCEKVIVVSNFSSDCGDKPITRLSDLAIKASQKSSQGLEKVELRSKSSKNVFLLRPSQQILRRAVDTDKTRINKTIDLGIRDAETFLKNFKAL